MKLVFNPGNTPVVYDNGLQVEPHDWAYVSEEGNDLNRLIEERRIINVAVPDVLPASVVPAAMPAMVAAIEDRQKHQRDPSAGIANTTDPVVGDTESTSPRNTGHTKRNKEA